MNEFRLAIFTLIGLVLSFPFILSCIFNPNGFENREEIALIILGLGIIGFPISVIGMYKIIKSPLFSEKESETY